MPRQGKRSDSSAGEDRRGQILLIAKELFARHGFHGVGLREIAARVGIRAPSLFKHFPNKHALYNAVLLSIFEELEGATLCLEEEGPAFDRLEAYVRNYVRLLGRDPQFVPLIFRELMERPEAIDPETRERAIRIHARVDRVLERGQRSGELGSVDRLHFHLALTGAILYHALAANSYLATVASRSRRSASSVTWEETIVAVMRGALVVTPPRTRSSRPKRTSAK